MNEFKTIILTAIFAFLVGFSLKFIKRKSKIVWWSSHNFLFELNPTLLVYTNAITVKNIGTKNADKIQITHKQAPEHFKIFPALNFTVLVNPQNEHVIEIDTLAPNDSITIEFLSLINAPQTLNIKSNDGQAQFITKVIYPLRWQILGAVLIFTTLGTIIYWLIQLIIILFT